MAANPFADPDVPTLAEVLRRVQADEHLPPARKRELASAIHTAARGLHRTPEEIPGSPAFLRRALARHSAAEFGVGHGRLRNIRSLLKRALEVSGVAPTGYLAPLAGDWQTLHNRIADPYWRQCLARFLRFLSNRGTAPDQVTDESVAAFHEALTQENLTTRPDTAVQSAVRIWNRLAETMPGWPQRRLRPLQRAERYTLGWGQLSESLRSDADRWLARLSGIDPTDELGPARALKPRSIIKHRYEILQYVSALHHRGIDVRSLNSLADLCTEAHCRAALMYFVERHRERHGETPEIRSSMIAGIAQTILAIARHYVRLEGASLRVLEDISRRLSRRQRGMTERNRTRLAFAKDRNQLRQLLEAPGTKMAALAQAKHSTRKDAVRFSLWLAVEILILAPMRIGNLAGLHLDQHFRWPRDRKGDPVGIQLPRGEVKNAEPLAYMIPAREAVAFHVYLDRFRPLLAAPGCRFLFPGRGTGPKRSDTLAKQISKLLHAELCLEFHPHLFRHLAAYVNIAANPGDYEGTRRLLGHRSTETTFNFYQGLEMGAAVEQYDGLIAGLRRDPPLARQASLYLRRRRRAG